MDAKRGFIARLAGGRRQSIGEADAVAEEVGAKPGLAAELWEAVSSPDALVGMRAVDALEKASAQRPEVLEGHAAEILEDLAASKFAQVRRHVGLLVPRLRLDPQQLGAAAEVLARLCDDQAGSSRQTRWRGSSGSPRSIPSSSMLPRRR